MDQCWPYLRISQKLMFPRHAVEQYKFQTNELVCPYNMYYCMMGWDNSGVTFDY